MEPVSPVSPALQVDSLPLAPSGKPPTNSENESENYSVVSDSLWPQDYTVHGILQARILEQVAFLFSRGFFQTRDWTQVSQISSWFFTSWATREAQEYWSG